MTNINAENILVRAPNWVGDLVMATPAFRSLRENFPKARITLLTKAYVKEVLQASPWFNEIIVYDPQERDKGIKGFLKLAADLRKKRFDLAILFTNSFSTAIMAKLARIRHIVGYNRNYRSLLLTNKIPAPKINGLYKPEPMVDYYLRICEYLDCPTVKRELSLFTDEENEKKAEEIFNSYGIDGRKVIIGLNVGAAYGSAKYWVDAYFAQVADYLLEKGHEVILFAGPKEGWIAEKIQSMMEQKPVNLANENLPLCLLKSLIRRCSLLITTDSGPRHLATAFGVPVIALLGPTDPVYSQTDSQTIVITEELECSPCMLRECPTDHRCMSLITPQRVIEAVEGMLTDRHYGNI